MAAPGEEEGAVRLISEGRLIGVFEGYQPGRVYRLNNGEVWEQVGNVVEHAYRERPTCRLLSDGQGTYLDIEGTSNVAEVRRYTGKRWAGGVLRRVGAEQGTADRTGPSE